ncbi:site-specific DNA-methyltransferase (adenine-specific)/modification methylase [Porphyromonadaceae bacterium KH3CP3RA]|nr:site-specific DNA-methyltransferase (adenine-specific)/modification methylase [Porphyromonadaceae bacterium KH3CP3RA]
MEQLINKVHEGDCLRIMENIPDKSIDLILCDPPYGVTQNNWDCVIPLDALWKQYRRIIKDNGAIVLTAYGIFTGRLIMSNPNWFRYKLVWIKSKSPNFLSANVQPLRKHEDICVFYKHKPKYYPQFTVGDPYHRGIRKDQHSSNYRPYKPNNGINTGSRYPTDVVAMDCCSDDYIYCKTAEAEGKVYHPTQKPVELARKIIRTYTDEEDVILDNACGSGSFLVAAILEKRQFIGIEKNEDVVMFRKKPVNCIEICNHRIEEALKIRKGA